jgi:hypothetical protein
LCDTCRRSCQGCALSRVGVHTMLQVQPIATYL